MSITLPDPKSLYSALVTLDRAISNFDLGRQAATYTQSSSDSTVSAVVNGLGRIESLSIDESLSTLTPAALAAKVVSVLNAAIDQASAATAASMGTFAGALSLPGLPAYGQSPPDYADFATFAQQLSAQVEANVPCQGSAVFSCEYHRVATVVDAQRRVVSLSFLDPLPSTLSELADQIVKALNCAIDDSTNKNPDPDQVTPGIVDSKGVRDLVLYANGTLKVGNDVQVLGLNCAGFAAVVNAGKIATDIGVHAQVGSITSVASVITRENSQVHGSIRTANTHEPHPGNAIDGPIVEHAVVILPTLALNVPFPATTQGTIEPEPGQQQTAAPGYYNKLQPKQNAQVFLSSGVYYFNELSLEPDSKVWINASSGPVVIWVKSSCTFRGQFFDSAGGFPRVFVGYLGTNQVSVERRYRGALCAPQAKINLASITTDVYEGAFYAKDIEAQPNSHICFHPFELPYTDLPGTAPVPPPVVDLGFENIEGWSCAQALLTSVVNPITQGAHSLQVTNVTGSSVIRSANFATALVPTGSTRLLVDLWVPTNQPNPTNWGNLTITISIPSAGIAGQSLGTLGITGKPQNQFSVFEFALPTAVQTALSTPRSDVSLAIQLNVTAGSGPWYLDDVRFLPPATPITVASILSFEPDAVWTCAQAAVATTTDKHTHLLKSLRITSPPAWLQVTSVLFSTATLSAPTGKMKIDICLPVNQPNSSWYGILQLFVSVPSLGVTDAAALPVQLRTLTPGQFGTIEVKLPTNIKGYIDGTYDVKLNLTFNLPTGTGPYYVDNIRFL